MHRFGRRLQKIGSSMLVSLPSGWIRSNNLKKGSMVIIEVNRDNSVSVFASEIGLDEVKEVSIPYVPDQMDGLINQVYGAYLLGYDIIRINGKSQISFENRELIKKAIQKLVGMEIVDEDGFNISSQFLLDANTLEAEKILRRMNSIIAGMFRDTIEGLKKRAQGIEKLIERRDDEVDRQYFLIVRLIRSAMMNQSLASKLNLSNIDILDYRIAANHLESAGDHIADFASEINEISKTRFIDAIVEAALLIENMQQGSVAAFVNRNRSESVQVVKIHADFKLVMDSIKQLSAKTELHDPESAIGIINVIHSLEKIARCWVDVADLVKPFYLTAPLRNA